MILLENPETGERALVRNAVGYRGWNLVDRKAPMPTESHSDWCAETRRWSPDTGAQERAARIAALRDPEVLLAMLERLPGGVEALDAIISTRRRD